MARRTGRHSSRVVVSFLSGSAMILDQYRTEDMVQSCSYCNVMHHSFVSLASASMIQYLSACRRASMGGFASRPSTCSTLSFLVPNNF